jgi:hypothetical protein
VNTVKILGLEEVPCSGGDAWYYKGFVIRAFAGRVCEVHTSYFRDGEFLNRFSSIKACVEFVDNGGAERAVKMSQIATAELLTFAIVREAALIAQEGAL